MVEDLMSRSMRGFQRSQKHLEKQAFKSTWARPSPNPIFRPKIYNPIIKQNSFIRQPIIINKTTPIILNTPRTCVICGNELRSRKKYCSKCRPWGTKISFGNIFRGGDNYDSGWGIIFLLAGIFLLFAAVFYAAYLFINWFTAWLAANIISICVILIIGGVSTFLISKKILKNSFPEFNMEKDLLQNFVTLVGLIISSSIIGSILIIILAYILYLLISSIIADIIFVIIIGIIIWFIFKKYNIINKINPPKIPVKTYKYTLPLIEE